MSSYAKLCRVGALCLMVTACVPAELRERLGFTAAAAPPGSLAAGIDRSYELEPRLATLSVVEDARVRARPVKGATVVDRVANGQRIDTLGRMAGTEYFLVVLPNGQTGYLHEDFLNTTAVATAAAPARSRVTASRAKPAAGSSASSSAPPWVTDPSGWRNDGRDDDRGDSGGGGDAGNAGSSL